MGCDRNRFLPQLLAVGTVAHSCYSIFATLTAVLATVRAACSQESEAITAMIYLSQERLMQFQQVRYEIIWGNEDDFLGVYQHCLGLGSFLSLSFIQFFSQFPYVTNFSLLPAEHKGYATTYWLLIHLLICRACWTHLKNVKNNRKMHHAYS